MARQLSVKQCQGPECRALRASRDEAQSQVRSLETDVRLLRAALDIALDSLYAMSDRWPFGTETVTHGRCITAIQQARAALAKAGAR